MCITKELLLPDFCLHHDMPVVDWMDDAYPTCIHDHDMSSIHYAMFDEPMHGPPTQNLFPLNGTLPEFWKAV